MSGKTTGKFNSNFQAQPGTYIGNGWGGSRGPDRTES